MTLAIVAHEVYQHKSCTGEDVFDLNRLMANDWTEKNMNFDTTRYILYLCMTRHGAFGPNAL